MDNEQFRYELLSIFGHFWHKYFIIMTTAYSQELTYPCNMVFVREIILPDPQESSYGADKTFSDFWAAVRRYLSEGYIIVNYEYFLKNCSFLDSIWDDLVHIDISDKFSIQHKTFMTLKQILYIVTVFTLLGSIFTLVIPTPA